MNQNTILSMISNGQLVDHFRIDVCREQYGATIDVGTVENGDHVVEVLEAKGFDVTHEADTIYTVTRNHG